uniref:Reverse transcriptase domain-containing protein n=1 Tax=Tanacetum cinerariifolium TaxID=118510 RepID=A0A6L2MYN5_TANCI|nr:reverse transcriptase domain-containing protein [Tanacetum cinerariifolium]
MTFMVIRSPSPYNGIIGRPGISAIRAVSSMAHGMLKFPVDGGIVTIYNTTVSPRECNTVVCDATDPNTARGQKAVIPAEIGMPTKPSPAPLRNKGSDLEVDNLALEGVAPKLAPSDFVSQNYDTLATLMQEETKKRDSRRSPVFTRIGKKVVGDQTADLQYLGTHENNGWRTNVHARLGSRHVQDRLGRRRSLSKSPPSSDSEDSRHKRRKRVSSSSSDSSDNEDEETGHWKSKNGYRGVL